MVEYTLELTDAKAAEYWKWIIKDKQVFELVIKLLNSYPDEQVQCIQ